MSPRTWLGRKVFGASFVIADGRCSNAACSGGAFFADARPERPKACAGSYAREMLREAREETVCKPAEGSPGVTGCGAGPACCQVSCCCCCVAVAAALVGFPIGLMPSRSNNETERPPWLSPPLERIDAL